jgi:hypothetical protein
MPQTQMFGAGFDLVEIGVFQNARMQIEQRGADFNVIGGLEGDVDHKILNGGV